MRDEWYLRRDGHATGPMSPVELATLARLGHIRSDDHIWCVDLDDWLPAAEVEGLVDDARPAVPAQGPSLQVEPRDTVPRLTDLYRAQLGHAVSLPAPRPPTCRVPPRTETGTRPEGHAWREGGAAARPSRQALQILAPTTVAADRPRSDGARSVGGWAGDLWRLISRQQLADMIVYMLDRFQIQTLDDLASDERLQALAASAPDALPLALRVAVNRLIGRETFERFAFELLVALRAQVPARLRFEPLAPWVRAYVTSDQIVGLVQAAWGRLALIGSPFGSGGSRPAEAVPGPTPGPVRAPALPSPYAFAALPAAE